MRLRTHTWIVSLTVLVIAFAVTFKSTVAQDAAPPAAKKYRSFFDSDLRRHVNMRLVEDRNARNSRWILVRKICKGKELLDVGGGANNKKLFDEYFMKYLFPMMTHPNELESIAAKRVKLKDEYFSLIKNDDVGLPIREHLNGLAKKFMMAVIGTRLGEFHPAVRYNAMLIIGDLNSRGSQSVGSPRPSDPWQPALDVMQEQLASRKQIDAVRIAALIGIARHAEADRHRLRDRRISDATLIPIVEELSRLAVAKKAPPRRSKAGHVWMRRQAVDTLASFAATRPISRVAAAIDSIAANPNEPLSLRVAAAQSQGKMLQPIHEGKAADLVAQDLMRIAVDCVIAELSLLKPYVQKLKLKDIAENELHEGGHVTPGLIDILPGESGSNTSEDDGNTERAPIIEQTQRRLLMRLTAVEEGLYGNSGGPGVVSKVTNAAAKSNASKMKQELIRTKEILRDETPSGIDPIYAEVDAYFQSLSVQGAAFNAIAPSTRRVADPPAGTEAGDPARPTSLDAP